MSLTALLLLLTSPVHADAIELITLHNRMADDVIPLIQPMLQPGEVVSGNGAQLILRASPASMRQIKQVIDGLDSPARNLTIQVRSDDEMRAAQQGIEGQVIVGNQGVSGGLRGHARQVQSTDNATQTIRVLEGSPARLRVGRETPYPQTVWVQTPYGMQAVPATGVAESGRWLTVYPRVQGNQVLLDIQPDNARPDPRHPGALDVQSLSTRVQVPLGEWVPLGGVDSQSQQRENANSATQNQSNRVWVKIDPAP